MVSVRYRHDLAYVESHLKLEQTYSNYRYLPLTTREPENLDVTQPNFVGKRYIQDYVASSEIETDFGFQISPETTHVYLCGSPAMVGLAQPQVANEPTIPKQSGMVELLERRGFRLDHPNNVGNIHVEQYW